MTRQTWLQGRPASGTTANLVSRARYAFGQRRDGDLMTKGTQGDEVAHPPNLQTGNPVQFIPETKPTCSRTLSRQPVDIPFREIFCFVFAVLSLEESTVLLYYLT